MNMKNKVRKVMREFKSGELKSSSGKKVTNPKQAIAIGLSEAGMSKKSSGGITKRLPSSESMGNLGMKEGGTMKESKKMVAKEIGFMKKKGAPKSMIKHEEEEAKSMGYARGGGIERKGKTKGKFIKMRKGGCA